LEWFWQVAGQVVQELPLQLLELWVEQVAVLEQQPLLQVGLVIQVHLRLLLEYLLDTVVAVEPLLLQQVTLVVLAYLVAAVVALTVPLVRKQVVLVVEV
jgi:hypothetical protein